MENSRGQMAQCEGRWHETLQSLRKEFRRGMSGEVADSMRTQGVDYLVNFGIQWHKLRDLAHSLPQDEELADLTWEKDVREMKLLSLLVRPKESLTTEKAMALVASAPNLEITEQLVVSLIAEMETAEAVAEAILQEGGEGQATHQSLVPYIIFMRRGMRDSVSVSFCECLISAAEQALLSSDLHPLLPLYISRSFSKVAEQTSDDTILGLIRDFAERMRAAHQPYATTVGVDLLDLIDYIEKEGGKEHGTESKD